MASSAPILTPLLLSWTPICSAAPFVISLFCEGSIAEMGLVSGFCNSGALGKEQWSLGLQLSKTGCAAHVPEPER